MKTIFYKYSVFWSNALCKYIYRFAHFLHVISPSDDMFKQMIPIVCWSIESLDLTEELKENLTKNFPLDYKRRKSAYRNACNTIKHLVNGNILYIITFLYIHITFQYDYI